MKRPKRLVSPRRLNSYLDTNILHRIIDLKILNPESIKQVVKRRLKNYDKYYETPVDLAREILEHEERERKIYDAFANLSDIIITSLPVSTTAQNVIDLFSLKYGIMPKHVRLLREKDSQTNKCFCLITLNEKDKQKQKNDLQTISSIVVDFNSQYKESKMISTNWPELFGLKKPADLKINYDVLLHRYESLNVFLPNMQRLRCPEANRNFTAQSIGLINLNEHFNEHFNEEQLENNEEFLHFSEQVSPETNNTF